MTNLAKQRYKIGRSKASKTLLVTGDIHVGSTTSVCTAEPEISELKMVYSLNKTNKATLRHWNSINDSLTKKVTDVVLMNGEGINGPNPKSNGDENWSSSIKDQIADAKKLFKMFKYSHIVGTRGSDYHVRSNNDNHDELLMKELNAVAYNGYLWSDTKKKKKSGSWYNPHEKLTDNFIWFDIHDQLVSAAHHIGFNKWQAYRSTSLAREMAALEFEAGKLYDARTRPVVTIRSHVHYYVTLGFSNTNGFCAPAWKFADSHLYRGGVAGTSPSVGALEIIFESNGEILPRKLLLEKENYPLPNVLHF
jgi:hypothetical protein